MSFPVYRVSVIAKYETIQCIWIFSGLLRKLAMTRKYRVEYLPYHLAFLTREVSLRTLESEKYPTRELSEYLIRSSWYRIRLVDIERDTDGPCCYTDSDRSGSSFREYTGVLLVLLEYFSCIENPLKEYEGIEQYFR